MPAMNKLMPVMIQVSNSDNDYIQINKTEYNTYVIKLMNFAKMKSIRIVLKEEQINILKNELNKFI